MKDHWTLNEGSFAETIKTHSTIIWKSTFKTIPLLL